MGSLYRQKNLKPANRLSAGFLPPPGRLCPLCGEAGASIGNLDERLPPVSRFDSSAARDCSVNAQIGGKTYCFGSDQAKADFMKDPEGNLAKAQAYYATKNEKNPGKPRAAGGEHFAA